MRSTLVRPRASDWDSLLRGRGAPGLGRGVLPQARPCRAEDVDPRTLVKEVLGVCGPAGGDQKVAGVAAPGASEMAEGRGVILERGDGRLLTAPALGRLLEE